MHLSLDKDSWQSMIKNHLQKSAKPLIVILGVTASGKTQFSIELAKYIGNAEIVNADSRQLFRGLDIGTGKIEAEKMQGVPHHLFDVLDPDEEVTAAWYKEKAEDVIDGILERESIPILVGGSMLYIAAITDGLSFDPEKRDELRSGESMCGYDLLVLGFKRERDETVDQINERIDTMFAQGWMEEVQQLIDQGYTESDPAMKSVGYKEIMHYLKMGEPQSLDELKELISAKTRQYAKRQRTWWRNDERICWIEL